MTLTIAATIIVAAYALRCAISPYGKHSRCKGKGRLKTAIRKRPKPCRRCEGTGLSMRWGRALYVWAKKTYKPILDEKRRAAARSAA